MLALRKLKNNARIKWYKKFIIAKGGNLKEDDINAINSLIQQMVNKDYSQEDLENLIATIATSGLTHQYTIVPLPISSNDQTVEIANINFNLKNQFGDKTKVSNDQVEAVKFSRETKLNE